MLKNGISSELLNIKSFLADDTYKFLIPDFQRDFVWRQGEAKQLLDDLDEDTNGFTLKEEDLQGYLLGNVVLIKTNDTDRYLVVDGQQRLTTISLICKSLEERVENIIAESTDKKEIKKWQMKLTDLLQSYAILDNDDDIIDYKITHDKGLNFGKVYKNILSNKPYEIQVESDSAIEEVYETIKSFLEDLTEEQLKNFISYFKSRVYFIVTVSNSYNKAFQLFEVLNDRGRSLEPLDLVKNLFLKTLSKDRSKIAIDEFNNDWNQFVSNLQIDSKRKISSSTFLKHYIIGNFGQNIKKEYVYEYFDKMELKTDDVIKLVKDLKNVSFKYAEIEKRNYDIFLKNDNNMFIIFKLFNIKQLHSLLIPFYDSPDYIKERILNLGVRLGASVLFTFTQMNFIESNLPSILQKFYKELESGKDLHESYNSLEIEANKIILNKATDIKQILPLKKLQNANGKLSNKAAIMLKFIELYFHNNSAVITQPKKQKITVEHILSKEIIFNDGEHTGFISKEDFDNHKNLIGNLTLLYNNENSSLSNKKYIDKFEVYLEQDFIITKKLTKELKSTTKGGMNAALVEKINAKESVYSPNENGHFSKDLIKKRSSEIADLIYDLVNENI